MKITMLILFFSSSFSLWAQKESINKTRFIVGLSSPELFHLGLTYRIANVSQISLNAGEAPSLGTIWPSISLEHRVHLGMNDKRTNKKKLFYSTGNYILSISKIPVSIYPFRKWQHPKLF